MHDIKSLESGISKLKQDFASSYDRNAHLYEAVPKERSALLDIPEKNLQVLHAFARSNPMYESSYDAKIAGVECTVYEGDISSYWLDSIKHDTSYAPFYPTWILSAYALAQATAEIGAQYAVDVGSGDGRIAYCTQAAGIDSLSVEIDENLAELQKKICSKTHTSFAIECQDATRIKYHQIKSKSAVFFIGGLPEVGEMLARGVISGTVRKLHKPVYVLAGTLAPRKTGRDSSSYGWGKIMEEFGLHVTRTVVLPTRWTVDQPKDTPYVFATPKD